MFGGWGGLDPWYGGLWKTYNSVYSVWYKILNELSPKCALLFLNCLDDGKWCCRFDVWCLLWNILIVTTTIYIPNKIRREHLNLSWTIVTFKDEQTTDLVTWTDAAQQVEVKGDCFSQRLPGGAYIEPQEARFSRAVVNKRHLVCLLFLPPLLPY